MPEEDKRDAYRAKVALKWCRDLVSTFRTEERRKVCYTTYIPALVNRMIVINKTSQLLGKNPYYKECYKPTKTLAREIMKVSLVPFDLALERTYTKHLALLVSVELLSACWITYYSVFF